MAKTFLENLIEKLEKAKLQLLILQLRLRVIFLQQKLTIPNLPMPKILVIHHGGGSWGFDQVNNHHRNKWGFKSSLGFYLGYQKWIEYTGQLYIARRDNEEGAHLAVEGKPHWWNRNSVGLCLQGNLEIKKPTEWQLMTLKDELDSYVARGFEIEYHGNIEPTACPGKYLVEWLKQNKYIK